MLFTEQKKTRRTELYAEPNKKKTGRTELLEKGAEPNRTNSTLGTTAKTRKPKGGVPRQRFYWSELPTRKTISRKKNRTTLGP